MADKMQTVNDLMITGLTYTLDFEKKAVEAAQQMASAAANPEAKQIFEQSQQKGQQYAQRIEQVFQKLGAPVQTNENHIAKALITEVQNMIQNTDQGPVRDVALIVAANQMQHYRISNYGSLETYAGLVGKSDAAEGLKQNLEDSKGGDAKLTKIAEETVNKQAAQANLQTA